MEESHLQRSPVSRENLKLEAEEGEGRRLLGLMRSRRRRRTLLGIRSLQLKP